MQKATDMLALSKTMLTMASACGTMWLLKPSNKVSGLMAGGKNGLGQPRRAMLLDMGKGPPLSQCS